MTRDQVMNYPYGEFIDLISCLAVFNGTAEEKDRLTFRELISLFR